MSHDSAAYLSKGGKQFRDDLANLIMLAMESGACRPLEIVSYLEVEKHLILHILTTDKGDDDGE